MEASAWGAGGRACHAGDPLSSPRRLRSSSSFDAWSWLCPRSYSPRGWKPSLLVEGAAGKERFESKGAVFTVDQKSDRKCDQ